MIFLSFPEWKQNIFFFFCLFVKKKNKFSFLKVFYDNDLIFAPFLIMDQWISNVQNDLRSLLSLSTRRKARSVIQFRNKVMIFSGPDGFGEVLGFR